MTRRMRRRRPAEDRRAERDRRGHPGRRGHRDRRGHPGLARRSVDPAPRGEGAGAAPGILGPVNDAHDGLIIALDGPGSSGKSSVGAAAALKLGYRFCDTGLLYRAATYLALQRGLADDDRSVDPAALVALLPEVALVADGAGRLAHVSVAGRDVTASVHAPEVDEAVSAVSRVPELRTALLERQRALAVEPGGIIMAGRDIGSVVLPDADLKIYLDASLEERARRRADERGVAPGGAERDEIIAQLRRRDGLDSSRAVAPLRVAEDAVRIVTDGNRFEETVGLVVGLVRDAEAAHPRPAGQGRRAVTADGGGE